MEGEQLATNFSLCSDEQTYNQITIHEYTRHTTSTFNITGTLVPNSSKTKYNAMQRLDDMTSLIAREQSG